MSNYQLTAGQTCDCCDALATKIMHKGTSNACADFFVGYYCDAHFTEVEEEMFAIEPEGQRPPPYTEEHLENAIEWGLACDPLINADARAAIKQRMSVPTRLSMAAEAIFIEGNNCQHFNARVVRYFLSGLNAGNKLNDLTTSSQG